MTENDNQYEEYMEWLQERKGTVTGIYKEIFLLLLNIDDFDACCKELGSCMVDMDDFILALNEYKNNLKEYVKPKPVEEKPRFKL